MDSEAWLEGIRGQFRWARDLSERAAAQVDDAAFFEERGPHSLAVLMKHVGGNHRSRWRDFLTTDGEKADRHREAEFDVAADTRGSVLALWDEGWSIAFGTLASLTPADLGRTVTIRGEPHAVVDAIHRNLTHACYHAGQIVLLARTLAGDGWSPLSIPPGGSEAFNEAMRARFGRWDGGAAG